MKEIPFLAGERKPAEMIREEIQQLKQEGRDPAALETLLPARDLAELAPEELAPLWYQLHTAPALPNFPFVEPSSLEDIRADRAAGWRKMPCELATAQLEDKMYGAWLGRCCGCALGKPVELFFHRHNGLSSKDRLKKYLQAVGPAEWPLNDYIPQHSPAEEQTGNAICLPSCRENIKFMETDDDIRYTILGQKVLLEHGRNFTSRDVMKSWLNNLPYGMVFTAETQAYRNYVTRYFNHFWFEHDVDWTWVATHQNPYREWIGAQIRADSWGYAAPGNPELAAEYAWRDARISHVKNGIYGEMFAAAMIAAAFVTDSPEEIVRAGLAEIPRRSRLYKDVEDTIALCRNCDFRADAFEEVLNGIYDSLEHYHPVHTINNAAVVTAAILLGKDDFEKAITIAVMGGWDTDCNGATVGSIVGAMIGAERIPPKWKAPLNDTLYSEVSGYHPIAISECARRSVEIALRDH
jgi:ADP-ribosylglycohydrolase